MRKRGRSLPRWIPLEQPLQQLEHNIAELKELQRTQGLDLSEKIADLERRKDELTKELFANLSPWDKVALARHQDRPYTLDYVQATCDEFLELHGDRCFRDDPAIVAGLAFLDGRPVAIAGHQKARTARERQRRNFGMAHPEGYRKALRVMRLAARMGRPIITFLDTSGAACLEEAEARGISEAIAVNQREMSLMPVPIVVVVIGEGGSGGAIGLGVGDHIAMLEHSYYSVIAPESCASILWRATERKAEMAAALKLTAEDALELGVIDEIIPEPLGGAHRDYGEIAARVKASILKALDRLRQVPPDELLERRYRKFLDMGREAGERATAEQ
ncbi:MAG: acetyl-CoA carboxylase carboxyltransferase subunit alpha [Armatimonadota bacterium]